jgi:toxin ParE1/3/4
VKVRLTEHADRDIEAALSDSYTMFGESQAAHYAGIIGAGIELVATEPERPASKARRELGKGVRSMHLQFAAKRQGGASHVLYYRVDASADGMSELVVLRLLGDRMEPRRRVALALRENKH